MDTKVNKGTQWCDMKREDHILWKTVDAYEVITELQFRKARGQIDAYQYAALVQPICMEVMNRLLLLIEKDGFITKAIETAKDFSEEKWDEKDRHRKYSKEYNDLQMRLFIANWITREYEKFMDRYRHAIFEPDPVKRASELVIGMDSLTNWAHGCFYIATHIMKMSPITGNYKTDHRTFEHMLYFLAAKGTAEARAWLIERIPAEF